MERVTKINKFYCVNLKNNLNLMSKTMYTNRDTTHRNGRSMTIDVDVDTNMGILEKIRMKPSSQLIERPHPLHFHFTLQYNNFQMMKALFMIQYRKWEEKKNVKASFC